MTVRRSLLTLSIIALALTLGAWLPPLKAAAQSCVFVRGFATLHDLIPDVVGECVSDERYDRQSGDSLQQTTRGLLVWRKLDNVTAFTNGATTWVNGPYGVQSRPADGWFAWEVNAITHPGMLFAPTSPWNLPARGAADADSWRMIDNLAEAMDGRGFAINVREYAVPLFYADTSTSWVRVRNSTDWWEGMDVPVPSSAWPDPGSDRHLAIWDLQTNRLFEFWCMRYSERESAWSAGYGITFDAAGAGYQNGDWENSARAYGGSLVAGAIRYHEMQRGEIPHALAMAYPFTRGDAFASGGEFGIASHNDRALQPHRTTRDNIPLGARLRLKESVNVAERCGNDRGCRVVGEALQRYGAFAVDTGGAPVLYAENLQGKRVTWDGLLGSDDALAFRAHDYEVLELPSLTAVPPPSGESGSPSPC